MSCPNEDEYKQMISTVQSGHAIRLGAGSFGQVYKVDDYVAKRIAIKDEHDRESYNSEVAVWKELTANGPLKPYLPAFCGARLIKVDLPPEPVAPEEMSPETMKEYWRIFEAWYTDNYDKPRAYAFIFQRFEPVRDLDTLFEEWRLKPISTEKGIELFNALVDGFNLFHKAGYIHRDIKPANILIRDDDLSPIIVDFGLACKTPCNETGVVGTMAYLPQNLLAKNNNSRVNNVCLFPVKAEEVGFLEAMKRRMGCSRKQARKRAVKVKLSNTVAVAKYNRASDRYALSIVLKELISVTDWTEYKEWKQDCEQIVARYRAEIVPFLAASKVPEIQASAGAGRRKTRRRQRQLK